MLYGDGLVEWEEVMMKKSVAIPEQAPCLCEGQGVLRAQADRSRQAIRGSNGGTSKGRHERIREGWNTGVLRLGKLSFFFFNFYFIWEYS